jgi:tetratricopeptide (TPR) repeat protein
MMAISNAGRMKHVSHHRNFPSESRRIAYRAIGVLLVLLGCVGAAFADDEIAKPTKAEAKAHLASGAGFYRAREFEKAIEEFKAGILVEDAPIFHFNLGQSYRQLGRYEDAIWHFDRFLRRANPLPPKYKDAVESLVRDMKGELDRKAMTRPPTDPADGEGNKEIAKPVKQPIPVPPPPSEAVSPWYADGLGWGLLGAGVVGGGVSVFLFVRAGALDDDANAEASQSRQSDLRDQASSRRLAGTIIGVVGAGALITGIVKLAIVPHHDERPSAVSLVFSTNGVAVTGRF